MGSVGSQTLTVLPVLHRLLAAVPVDVWPFTTGLRRPATGRSIVAESWPAAFDLDLTRRSVRDAAQVQGLGRRRVAALQDEREPDVLDAASGRVDLVHVPVLHQRARERQLAYARDVGHGLGSGIQLNGRIHGWPV